MSKVICIIQARMNSTRLKGKVLRLLANKEVLSHVVERIKKARNIDEVIVATTVNKDDDEIVNFCKKENVKVYRGSELDVLERYYEASKKALGDIIIRITSDCPCIDYRILEEMVDRFKKKPNIEYYSNTIERTFPRGYDIEIFTFNALQEAYKKASEMYQREHVTPYLYENNSFKLEQYKYSKNMSKYRVTLDTKEDYVVLNEIFNNLYIKNKYFEVKDVIEFLEKNSEISEINKEVIQKEIK